MAGHDSRRRRDYQAQESESLLTCFWAASDHHLCGPNMTCCATGLMTSRSLFKILTTGRVSRLMHQACGSKSRCCPPVELNLLLSQPVSSKLAASWSWPQNSLSCHSTEKDMWELLSFTKVCLSASPWLTLWLFCCQNKVTLMADSCPGAGNL